MGYYIQGPLHGKAKMLVEKHDAILLGGFKEAQDAFNSGLGVICVVNNGPFEAAGFAFSQQELEVFGDPKDRRAKVWLAMDREKAEELSEFPKKVKP